MNKILKTSIAFLTLASSVAFASFNANNSKNEIIQTIAKDKSFEDDLFVNVSNFLYSGKGFLMEFEYTLPNKTTIMPFSLMNFGNNWHRLTETFSVTFGSNGTISTPIGHIFEIDGHHYFQLMFSDLVGHLNTSTGEVANGTETVDGFYIRDDTVGFKVISTQLISTDMNAYPVSEIRNDSIPGLTFKAFTPKLIKDAKYGMIIVPSSYIKDMDDDFKHHFDENNIPYINLECNPVILKNSDPIYKVFGDGYSFKGSIVNIKEENYQIPFVAIPYYELDGRISYSNFIRNTKSTYYKKCKEFIASSAYQTSLDIVKEEASKVIYKCEHHISKVEIANVKAYFKSNAEKVFKDATLPDVLVTENVMYSAKNEVERGQIIINVPSNFGSKPYFATFEPFINSADPSQVISSDNVKIEQQLYQNVLTNWSVGNQQSVKWYPDGVRNYDLPLGYVPDALLPFDVAFDSGRNNITSENGRNNALSFTINVPEGIASGEYNSKIVIKISEIGTLALPIKLNVFDFELPDENKAKEIIIVNTGETKALYGESAGSISSAHNLSAYEMLKERNISGGQVPATCWSTGDLENFIKVAKEYVTDKKIGAYFIPNSYTNISLDIKLKKSFLSSETISLEDLSVYRANDVNYDSTIVLPGVKTTLRELVKASTNEIDLLKKGVFYLPQADEPGNRKDKQLQNVLCQNVISRCIDELLLEDLFTGKDKVKESLSKVGYIVTSYPRECLDGSYFQSITSVTPKSGYEDICACCYCSSLSDLHYTSMKGYCPTYDSYQHDIANAGSSGYQYLIDHVNDPDFTIWWYSCIQPISPYPSMFINANLIQKRVNTWTMYQMGIEGELYYMCNRTQEYTNSTSIPHNEEEILLGKATYEGTYGDGNLLYPVHRMLGKYDPSLYWLSSLRLDNIAESIDDYNYIAYANELLNKIPNSESYKNQLDDLLDAVNDGPGRNTTDINLFNRQRIALGNLVAELASK